MAGLILLQRCGPAAIATRLLEGSRTLIIDYTTIPTAAGAKVPPATKTRTPLVERSDGMWPWCNRAHRPVRKWPYTTYASSAAVGFNHFFSAAMQRSGGTG